jgi:hypothetical protein
MSTITPPGGLTQRELAAWRREKALSLYASGYTLKAAGEAVGVSESRVCQIIKQSGDAGEAAARAHQALIDEQVAAEVADAMNAGKTIIATGVRVPNRDVFAQLIVERGFRTSTAEAAVNQLMREASVLAAVDVPSRDLRRWTPENIAPVLVEAARQVEPSALTSTMYVDLRTEHNKTASEAAKWPSTSTIVETYGSWGSAIKAAGIPYEHPGNAPVLRQRPSTQVRDGLLDVHERAPYPVWTPMHPSNIAGWAAAVHAAKAPGDYTRAALRRTPGAPSDLTVRVMFGGLHEALLWAQSNDVCTDPEYLLPVQRRWTHWVAHPDPTPEQRDAFNRFVSGQGSGNDATLAWALITAVHVASGRERMPAATVEPRTWGEMFERFARWVRATGTVDVPESLVTTDGVPLGAWVAGERSKSRAEFLEPVQVRLFEAVPGWRFADEQAAAA